MVAAKTKQRARIPVAGTRTIAFRIKAHGRTCFTTAPMGIINVIGQSEDALVLKIFWKNMPGRVNCCNNITA
jgi:hypothetical protein